MSWVDTATDYANALKEIVNKIDSLNDERNSQGRVDIGLIQIRTIAMEALGLNDETVAEKNK